MTTPASIILEFGEGVDGDSAFVKVELDEVRNVDAAGEAKTEFNPGDDVYFLVQIGQDLAIDWVLPTSGTVNQIAAVKRKRTQELVFTPQNLSKDLDYIPTAQPTVKFYGKTPALKAMDGVTLALAGIEELMDSDPVPSDLPAVCDVEYDVEFRSFRFVPPPMNLPDENSEYKVRIVIKVVNK